MKDDFDILIKGKVAQVGEERTWSNGKKYKKTSSGWVPVSDGKSGSESKEDPKSSSKKDTDASSKTKATKKDDSKSAGKSEESKSGKGVKDYSKKKKLAKTRKPLKDFLKSNKQLFDTGEHAHPHRSKAAKFLRGKAKGLVKGLKHEVHHIKDAGSAIQGLFKGKKPTKPQQKALRKVGITLGLTVASMMATGGVGGLFAKGGVTFMKNLAVHFVEHVVAETTLLSTIFAKAEKTGEMSDEDLQKLVDGFIVWLEKGDWSSLPEKMQDVTEESEDQPKEDIQKANQINMSFEDNIRHRRLTQLSQMSKAVTTPTNDLERIYKAIQNDLVAEEDRDLLVKGKELPVGTIRQRGDQNWIKTGDKKNPWKYHSKVGSKKAKEANVTSSADEVDAITAEDFTPEKMEGKTLASKLFTLVNKVGSAKTFGEQMTLIMEAGITDPEKVVELSNADLSDVLKYMDIKQITPKTQHFSIQDELAKLEAQPAIKTGFKKIPVKERWESYRVFLDMVADGTAKSMIAYGTGGIGKTYNATKIFAKNKLAEFDLDVHQPGDEGYDYVKITGKTSPTALYAALHEHNGKCLMFDDCDSVLEHDDSINILKGALDSGGDNAISYASGKKMKDSQGNTIPQRFKFTGRVAFITNLDAEKMPQPLRSRAFTADLTMTPEETVEMMEDIIHKIEFQNSRGEAIQVSTEDRQDAMDFVSENVHNINVGDLNSRTLGQIALLKRKLGNGGESGLHWKTAAISMLS